MKRKIKKWRDWGRAGLVVISLAVVILTAVPPKTEEQKALESTHNDALAWPILARTLEEQSATKVMAGRQLIVLAVVNPQGAGTKLTQEQEEVIRLCRSGAGLWRLFSGKNPLEFHFEVKTVEFRGDLAIAEREVVVAQVLDRIYTPSHRGHFLGALDYVNQRRREEGWDGVSLAVLPDTSQTALAYINGPYLWFPMRNPSFKVSRVIASFVFMHELGHIYGAYDLYGAYNPDQVGGVDAVANGRKPSGIMQTIPRRLEELTVAEATLGQVFGQDADSDRLRNPWDVAPVVQPAGDMTETGGTTIVSLALHPGEYAPPNPAFGTGPVILNQVVLAKAWVKDEDGWKPVGINITPRPAGRRASLVLSVPSEARVAVKVKNTIGNEAVWCSQACPHPWPGQRIYLPLVCK